MSDDLASDPDALRARIEQLLELLQPLVDDPTLLGNADPALRTQLHIALGRLTQPDKATLKASWRAQKRKKRNRKRDADEALLDRTGIRQARANPIFQTPRRLGHEEATASRPSPGTVHTARNCYVCRRDYRELHFFYDQMCPECGDFNHAKRHQTADLSGRVALLTGGRVKIGYQVGIMLLRAGCRVVVTTRFPRDAASRYAREDDFEAWRDRLEIHGIDLRHIPSVEALCERLVDGLDRLDFIVNNACQTVRRPPGFYDHLMAAELADALPDAHRGLLAPVHSVVTADAGGLWQQSSAALSQVPLLPEDYEAGAEVFPVGHYDADLQQVDLRTVNSWRLKMAEVPTIELLEVHLVNAVAPFLLNARLKPLMLRVPTRDKHIVNVSAMEGQFYRNQKTDRHPHTNMAKASLNMMTRTSAMDYVEDGIHMNCVDTGWVTDEDPAALAEAKREMHRFHPPLDIVDGAARIVDPIFHGFNTGEHIWGQFLKDYRITDW